MEMDRFSQETGIELPSSFGEFFTTFSNGYSLTWENGEESGEFQMPSIDALADQYDEWKEFIGEYSNKPQNLDQCVEPDFRQEAFRIWQRMKGWIPFIAESEGDSFCLDLANGTIVFDKHDWYDGFGEVAETNGMIAGSSLPDFIRIWGRFSFMPQFFTDSPHPAGQTHLEWLEWPEGCEGGSKFERGV
jgi:cell wall assembly regulator SMI1